MLFVGSKSFSSGDNVSVKLIIEATLSSSDVVVLSTHFATQPEIEVQPHGSVYVAQAELAVVTSKTVEVIGSADATTCVIVCIYNRRLQQCGVAHIDRKVSTSIFEALIGGCVDGEKTMEEQSLADDDTENLLEISLVGGYDDERKVSVNLIEDIFKHLLKLSTKYPMRLMLACIGKLNTLHGFSSSSSATKYNKPLAISAAVNLKTGEVFQARFLSRGPEYILRSQRCIYGSCTETFTNAIKYVDGQMLFVVSPFQTPRFNNAYLQQCINTKDEMLLADHSTSPRVEPVHFCSDLRNAFEYWLHHTSGASCFPNKTPLLFCPTEDGCWIPFC